MSTTGRITISSGKTHLQCKDYLTDMFEYVYEVYKQLVPVIATFLLQASTELLRKIFKSCKVLEFIKHTSKCGNKY